ncbi:MAG: phosphonate C-P lyase system protein PhnG [Hydrogenophaga sp.]|uniref:phosphonate C-P lyase system protein PhnG n=1 Tax=Hydrogenophaga sp. TaxID=1904254 RepID=UPI00260B337D|nr:phosphonate C-P lyase system protein PhnG [Hydrogenophaga sp.]MDM7942216.1 phosphonate C-P lyase system protein PhnG [Hydrogenophaga sp.]
MFHAFDNSGPNRPLPRPDWMALLARAPLALLENSVATHLGPGVHWLRRPETGLMMVQGRVGGTAERFNLGEITVTRCALRLEGAPAGVAWVMGRDARRCTLAAVADALLQDPRHTDALDARLLQPVREHLQQLASERAARAQSTRVDFFTMVRESDGGADAGDDA